MHIWKHTCLLLAHFGTKCINVKWIYFKKHYRGTECKYYKDPSINSLLILSKLNSYLNYPFTYTNCMFLMHLHSTLKQGLYQFFSSALMVCPLLHLNWIIFQGFGLRPNQVLYGALMNAAFKVRNFDYLHRLMQNMKDESVKPNERIISLLHSAAYFGSRAPKVSIWICQYLISKWGERCYWLWRKSWPLQFFFLEFLFQYSRFLILEDTYQL